MNVCMYIDMYVGTYVCMYVDSWVDSRCMSYSPTYLHTYPIEVDLIIQDDHDARNGLKETQDIGFEGRRSVV